MYSLIVFYIIKMSSMSALLFVTLFITQSHSLTLFKTFTNGMVLQSAPTGAAIWGYLDNNSNNIEVIITKRKLIRLSQDLHNFHMVIENNF